MNSSMASLTFGEERGGDSDSILNSTIMTAWNESLPLAATSSSSSLMGADTDLQSSEVVAVPAVSAPVWMIELMEFRQRLFLRTVEPIIVGILGPTKEIPAAAYTMVNKYSSSSSSSGTDDDFQFHRRLGFLPDYVEDASSFRETSMSFATLVTLFVTMTCILLIFLSCFYHNQKTSPLFISPRRHRLPKLVPPPLPIEGYFDWVRRRWCFLR